MNAIFMPLYKNDALLKVIDAFPELSFSVAATPEDLERQIGAAEILVTNNRVYDETVGRIVCGQGTALRWIQFSTSGVERGLKYGLPRGIPVCNAAGVKAPTVAEHAFTLLLASVRRLRDMEAARGRRIWARHEINPLVRSLEGATLVIVGLGAIGQEIARKAKAFDMYVIAVTREGRPGPTVDEVAPRTRLREVLARADVVALSAPSTTDNFHMIGAGELASMKREAVLLNISRGELIDEAALIRALKEGSIAGAALDVTEVEPLPPDSELWTLSNVLISPHVAGSGSDGLIRFLKIFGENLRRYKAGLPLNHQLEWEQPEAVISG